MPAPTKIRFACPKCDIVMHVGRERAGKTATCPECGAAMTVPRLQAPAAAPAGPKPLPPLPVAPVSPPLPVAPLAPPLAVAPLALPLTVAPVAAPANETTAALPLPGSGQVMPLGSEPLPIAQVAPMALAAVVAPPIVAPPVAAVPPPFNPPPRKVIAPPVVVPPPLTAALAEPTPPPVAPAAESEPPPVAPPELPAAPAGDERVAAATCEPAAEAAPPEAELPLDGSPAHEGLPLAAAAEAELPAAADSLPVAAVAVQPQSTAKPMAAEVPPPGPVKVPVWGYALSFWPLVLAIVGGFVGGLIGGGAAAANFALWKTRWPTPLKVAGNLGTGIVACGAWLLLAWLVLPWLGISSGFARSGYAPVNSAYCNLLLVPQLSQDLELDARQRVELGWASQAFVKNLETRAQNAGNQEGDAAITAMNQWIDGEGAKLKGRLTEEQNVYFLQLRQEGKIAAVSAQRMGKKFGVRFGDSATGAAAPAGAGGVHSWSDDEILACITSVGDARDVLHSGEYNAQRYALDWIRKNDPPDSPERRALVARLGKLLEAPPASKMAAVDRRFQREEYANVFCRWCGRGAVPTLQALARTPTAESSCWQPALAGLLRLDPNAAVAIINERGADPMFRNQAFAKLREQGKAADPLVRQLAKSSIKEVRDAAERELKSRGLATNTKPPSPPPATPPPRPGGSGKPGKPAPKPAPGKI